MKYLFTILLSIITHFAFSQNASIDNQYKKEVIGFLNALMQVFYIFPDMADKTSEYLEQFKKEKKKGPIIRNLRTVQVL